MKRFLTFLCTLCALCYNSHAQYILTNVAGTGTTGFTGDGGPATAAPLASPYYVYYARNGNYYFVFQHGVRMVDPTGIVNHVAGGSTVGYSGDGGPASAALFQDPRSVTGDTTGNLYIGDNTNHVIRKINTAGIISNFAGNHAAGYSGDGGQATAASFTNPAGMVTDKMGNLYFADLSNHCVRKINAGGIITTVAGTGTYGFSGDGGPATAAKLYNPCDVDIDTAGNLFIVDASNNRIRKINTAGIINTVAGSVSPGFSGDNGPATLAKMTPNGITVDKAGNLIIAEGTNNRIRVVNTAGIITTIAGNGTGGYSDHCDAKQGMLKRPVKVALDTFGDMYAADFLNNRIRKLCRNFLPEIPSGPTQSLYLCKNAPAYNIDFWLSVNDTNVGQPLNWVVLTPPAHGTYNGTFSGISSGSSVATSGLFYQPNPGFQGTDTFRITVTDCSNGIDTMSIFIYVYDPAIGAGSITGVDTVCVGHSITLTDTIAGGTWSPSNTNATASGGVVTGVTPGTVTIRYIINNSCLNDTATKVIAVKACPNGIASTSSKDSHLQAWPNPNDGTFNLTVFEALNEEVMITITDVMGKLVGEVSTTTNKATPANLDVAPGLYFVTAQTQTAVWSTKMVIH